MTAQVFHRRAMDLKNPEDNFLFNSEDKTLNSWMTMDSKTPLYLNIPKRLKKVF